MRKLTLGQQQRQTHPLVWLLAILCTVLAIAVIIVGLVIFVGYLIIKPKIPNLKVTYAHLDTLNYDQVGELDVQITLSLTATNENAKARVRFSDISFLLLFDGVTLAELRADTFEVPNNSTVTLPYVIQSSSNVLEGNAVLEEMDSSLKRDKISFRLKGATRTRWKVGILGSVKFRTHLSCQLDFAPSNGSIISPTCSSDSS